MSSKKPRYSAKLAKRSKKRARQPNYQYNSRLPMMTYPQVEKKYLDWYWDNGGAVLAAATGSFKGDILNIVAGGDVFNRIGNKITLRNVNVRGELLTSATLASNTSMTVRLLLVLDKQANGAVPAYSVMYDPPFGDPTTSAQRTATVKTDQLQLWLRNMSTAKRFQILKEKTITLNPPGLSAVALVGQQVTKFFKISWRGALPISYASSAAATPTTNNVFLVAVPDQDGATTGVAIKSVIRVKYTDL